MAKQPKKNLKKRTRDSNGVPMAGGGGCDDSAAALPTMASTHVDPLDGVEHPPQAPSSLQQDPSAAELTLATLSSSLTGSSSADSASSSGSSDGTSSSTGSSSSGKEDDSERRYPRFSASYARTFKHDMTPFVRVIDEVKTPNKIASSSKPLMDARRNSNSLVHVGSNESSEFHSALSSPFTSPKMAGIASPNAKNAAKKSAATTATANNNNNVTAAPANPERIVILYGTYRMVKLLGRGTFSKVVRALRINDGSNLVSSRSQVLEVAIKIFRDRNSYREACWEEITILQALCQNNFPITNVTGASSCAGMADVMMCASSEGRFIPMLDFIQHPVHPAIIYPLMGPCLLDTLRVVRLISRDAASLGSSSDVGKHKKDVLLRGLPMPLLKVVIYQILQFLSYAHARGIVHTDLKPENVLFESRTFLNQEVPIYACRPVAPAANAGRSTTPDNPRGASSAQPKFTKVLDHIIQVPLPHLNAIRVADLGSSLFTSTFRSKSLLDGVTPVSYSVIQTNHYRAPEVLLGVGWNASADIFSLGCMIPELLSGNCLFKPKDTMEHLAIMEQVLGPIHAESFPSKRKKRSTPKKSSTRSVGSDTSTSEKPVSTLSEVYTLNGLSYLHHFDPSTGRLRYPVTKQLVAARKARDEMVPPDPMKVNRS